MFLSPEHCTFIPRDKTSRRYFRHDMRKESGQECRTFLNLDVSFAGASRSGLWAASRVPLRALRHWFPSITDDVSSE